MFGAIATLLGCVVDAYSLYQIYQEKKQKQGNTYQTNYANQKKSGALSYILLVVGTLVLIVGIGNIMTSLTKSIVGTSNGTGTGISDNDSDDSLLNLFGGGTDNTADAANETKKNQKIWIEDMQVFAYDDGDRSNNKYRFEKSMIINTGDNLQHALIFNAIDNEYDVVTQYLEFYLNGNYSNFNATLALTDEAKEAKGVFLLEIKLDDESVEKIQIAKGLVPVNIDLDVSSAKIMKIEITNLKNYWETSEIAFGDAYFTTK